MKCIYCKEDGANEVTKKCKDPMECALRCAVADSNTLRSEVEALRKERDEWKRVAEANMATAEKMAEAAEEEGHSAREFEKRPRRL